MLEPPMPRTELRQAATMVAVTLVLAALAVAGAVATDGAVNKVLILAAPAIVFLGAMVTGIRAFQCRREGGRWYVLWGGMWLLFMIFLMWVLQAIALAMA